MSDITVSKLRADMATAVNKVAFGKERLIICRQGKKLAALIPMEDFKALEILEDKLLAQLADEAMAESGEDVSWEQLKKERGL